MCNQVGLRPIGVASEVVAKTVEHLRGSHSNGGAFLASVCVADSDIFDWFASRNRLLEYGILPSLLRRSEIRELLPDLSIPTSLLPYEDAFASDDLASFGGFKIDNSFLLDGQLASRLYAGGAYPPVAQIDARTAKHLALDFCDALFGLRYEDVFLYSSYETWTPWFFGIAWDWTAVLFDKRDRAFRILAVTDTD
jgi:hypothetical protein